MSQALYRRYRPETFAEVIGQEHVTEPLAQALRADRVTHAYLFSGPRGCGKTTSARILARCLNCAQGPTPEPCGTCDSCVELGRGGSGSLDVVEIDAASHNGVDDARDLRERAAFAPARDRYKVFILDEAHMVTPQGFNALLKIVEEPPPHVKFIFATTEPDKVIGTIRSRTHHYPFRLVAPDTLLPYLEQLCQEESVAVGAGVLPLVVRAGGGSVRDSLSVLDQLIAGAGEGGLDYERSVALLGYTHAALLDDVVGAISTRDGASAFRVVDRVISSGHEPRRFIEDLLERLRDLIVIAASGESARAALRDLPSDQLERMRAQAAALGPAELSRSADLVNTALTEMTGATSPRLHLELLVARLLLPAMDDGGVVARLERVERAFEGGPRVAPTPQAAPVRQTPVAAPTRAAAAAPEAPVAAPTPAPESRAAEPTPPASRPSASERQAPTPKAPEPASAAPKPPTAPSAAHSSAPTAAAAPAAQPEASPTAAPPAAAPPAAAPPAAEAEMVRRRWPEVLQTLRGLRMASWALVSQNAQVASVEADVLRLAFTTPQLAQTFRTGPHAEHVRRALRETLGLDVRVEPVLAPSGGEPAPRSADAPGTPTREQAEASWGAPARTPQEAPAASDRPGPQASSERPAAPARPAARAERRDSAPARRAPDARPTGPSLASDGVPDAPEPDEEPEPPEAGTVPARQPAARPDQGRGAPASPAAAPPRSRPASPQRPSPSRPAAPAPAPDDGSDASPDDPELVGSGLVGAPLIAQMLGGTVIDEIPEEQQ